MNSRGVVKWPWRTMYDQNWRETSNDSLIFSAFDTSTEPSGRSGV